VYGDRDVVDLEKMRALGVPFWLAGGYGRAGGLCEARAVGAQGIQVGTAFAFCDESGMRTDYKVRLRQQAAAHSVRVTTDPLASPTSFPLKVAQFDESVSNEDVYAARTRVCDLGYLREAYRTPEGTVGFRCAAEPVATFVSKGGRIEDTNGRKCICNALVATMGHPQVRGKSLEPPLITSGNALDHLDDFMLQGRLSFTAAEVIEVLLAGEVPA
jgi:nitronate monooxygenase